MNLNKLSAILHMSTADLSAEIIKLSSKYDLDIEDVNRMQRHEYETVRALLDPQYVISKFWVKPYDGSNDYSRDPDFGLLCEWIMSNDLCGLGITRIKNSLPENIDIDSNQRIAAALKKCGYTNKVVVVRETGKQARRWFRDEMVDLVSTVSEPQQEVSFI